ncbi:MAG: hypothetical protein CBE47_03280 [Pelagibacteraceae bacterium TMED287]|nr:MAG: hypothetical protein CBE47_03280 [Pelagibacteraceae bacterium TMED287]
MKFNQQIVDTFKDLKRVAKSYPGRLIDVLDCFNQNQYDSKTWLVDCLNQYPYHFKMKTNDSVKIAILAGWYGLMAKLVSENFTLKPIGEIHSYDFDPFVKNIGKLLFPEITFVEQDITELDLDNKGYSIVINTSCEHIDQSLLYKSIDTAPANTLFVLQSNNMSYVQQHINCVDSLQMFEKQYESRLDKVRAYELHKEKYTRYMLIGVKR